MTRTFTQEIASATSFRARLSLLAVSVAIALPSPWASLWGGSENGPLGSVLVMGSAWALFIFFGKSVARKKQEGDLNTRHSGLFLMGDVLALSTLLFESGAAQNPFTMLYFVPITLATVMAPSWTGRIALFSVLMFGLLLARTAQVLAPHRTHPHHAHFFHHVQGMAIALAVAGAFITFFVLRFARSLAKTQSEIESLRTSQQNDRFAVALGALSAGAAHELGTPLGTLQLLAQEFQLMSPDEQKEAADTMVQEIQRMKNILHTMSSTELSAEVLDQTIAWDPALLGSELAKDDPRLHLQVGSCELTDQPESTLRQIVRELLRNAERASLEADITLHIRTEDERLIIAVEDTGPGLRPELLETATDPFLSASGGTGLGLFLVSVHARQLGGQFALAARTPHGTIAQLNLPLRLPAYRRQTTEAARKAVA